MNNKLLQQTKRLLACAALGGLISATPAALAVPVQINFSGTVDSNPFSAVLHYDSDVAFTLAGNNTWLAGGPGVGSITVTYNGSTNTDELNSIVVVQNGMSGGTYNAAIGFYGINYQLVIDGGRSDSPFNWTGGLLPTGADPIPFDPQDSQPIAFYFHLPHGTVDSYAVSDVPVPAAAWLLGSGLIGLGSLARRRRV